MLKSQYEKTCRVDLQHRAEPVIFILHEQRINDVVDHWDFGFVATTKVNLTTVGLELRQLGLHANSASGVIFWVSYLSSLRLGFFNCKMKIIMSILHF